jgi:hypothetical protein
MVAWLISMVPGTTQEVITILNYRLSPRTVGAIMERLYIERRAGLSVLLEYTKTGKANCPWKSARVDGVPWSEELWCGSGDRFSWARKVDNLKVINDENGREKFVWTERKRPDLSAVREAHGPPSLEGKRL